MEDMRLECTRAVRSDGRIGRVDEGAKIEIADLAAAGVDVGLPFGERLTGVLFEFRFVVEKFELTGGAVEVQEDHPLYLARQWRVEDPQRSSGRMLRYRRGGTVSLGGPPHGPEPRGTRPQKMAARGIGKHLLRRVLLKDIQGRPREYEIEVTIRYSVTNPDGTVIVPPGLVTRRANLELDPSDPLARAGNTVFAPSP